MAEDGWREGAALFLHNLSPYYALSLSVTALAFILSFFYTKHVRSQIYAMKFNQDTNEEINRSDKTENEIDFNTDDSNQDTDALQSRIKGARHQAIVTQLSANMTQEQLMEEKEVEKAQLEAILNLLKEQKEKFQVANMEELEEQLSLYR